MAEGTRLLGEIRNEIAALRKLFEEETKWERRLRMCLPVLVVVAVWAAGAYLLIKTQNGWGEIADELWATVVLRSAVLLGGIASMTAVSIAAMRREW